MVSAALVRDAAREIRKSLLRFIAISAIVGLGTAFFVGVRAASPDMKKAATEYFSASNFMDFTLLSTAGFTADDVAAIRAVTGVRGAAPAYSADAVTSVNGEQKVLHILSLPPAGTAQADDMNRPYLKAGRLPERADECVIEQNKITGVEFNIGDTITLSSGTDYMLALTTNTFTVAGIIDSPLYMAKDRGTASIGSGSVSAFVMVPQDVFAISGPYSAVYVTSAAAQGKQAYSSAYDDAIAPLKTALTKLAATRATADTQQYKAAGFVGISVQWYVTGRSDNTGYADYGAAADRVAQIALVFPLIFIFVAILVCLTSMSRMVEERRAQMGVIKALGYSRVATAMKFLLFALCASVLGCAAGLAAGFTVFPYIICRAYAMLYTVPYTVLAFSWPYAAGAIIAALLVTGLSALATCYGELSSPAAALMCPRAPKPGKRILLERTPLWRHLTFTRKTTARNIFRYKSRALMTVAGVALCTALLLVGFGLNDAVSGIGEAQFGEIDRYQFSAVLQSGISGSDRQNLEDAVAKLPGYRSMQRADISAVTAGGKSCYLVVPERPGGVPEDIRLTDSSTGAALPLTGDGVIVSEKLASLLKLRAGDDLTLSAGPDGAQRAVKISGVCTNYLYHYIYMSPALYEKISGAAPVYNEINVRLSPYDKADNAAVSAKLVALPGVAQVAFMTDHIDMAADITKSIYSVVLVLIVSAALLSFIVLFTLANINIGERLREIATLRVLGFFRREAAAYVLRENLLLTVLGLTLGLLLGVPLTRYVSGTAEVENIRFVHAIHPLSFALAAALTLVFAVAVDIAVRPRLRRIDMVEALKTVE